MSNEQTQATQQETHDFSKAQMKQFNKLQAEAQRAQAALQDFVTYLSDEHDLDPDLQWQIGPKGFIATKEAAPLKAKANGSDGESAAPKG